MTSFPSICRVNPPNYYLPCARVIGALILLFGSVQHSVRAEHVSRPALQWQRLDAAASQMSQHNDRNAEKVFLEALSASEKVSTDAVPALETSRDLADYYWKLGRLDAAEKYYKSCLSRARNIYGPDHQELDPILERLSHLYMKRLKFVEADQCLRALSSIRRKSLSRDHARSLRVKQDQNLLLASYVRSMDTQSYADLQKWMLERADTSAERDFRLEDTSVFTSRVLNAASPNFTKAVPLMELTVSEDRKDGRRSYALHYLGHQQASVKKLERASQLLEECVAIRTATKDYRNLISSLEGMGEVRRLQHRPEEAATEYKRALDTWDNISNSTSERYVDVLYVGISLFEANKAAEAAPWITKALRAFSTSRLPNDPYLIAARQYVELSYHKLNKDKEARELLESSVKHTPILHTDRSN